MKLLSLLSLCLALAGPGRAQDVPGLTRMQANSRVMNLSLTREGKALTLRDTADAGQFAGRQTAFYVNGQYLGPSLGRFHPLPGTRLSVVKLILQPGDNPTHFWEIHPVQKANAVVAIPDGAPAARKKRNPTRNFLPAWYEDRAEYRPSKFAPKFTLTENKVNASLLKRSDVAPSDALGRGGMTQIEAEHVTVDSLYDPRQQGRYGLPSTHVFDATGKTNGKDLTRDEVREVAGGFGPFGLLGDQFGEGNAAFPLESDQEYWFYERAREIAADPQCRWTPVFFGTYGSFGYYIVRGWNGPGGVQVPPSDPTFKKYYDTPALAASSCAYFDRMYRLTDANVSWYPGDFGYGGDLYKRVHSIQVMKMGQAQKTPARRTFLFWWYGIEDTDNGFIHNGFHWEHDTTDPPGRATYEEHPVVDLNTAIGMCLIGGFVVGDGVIGWDNNIQFDPDPNAVGRDQLWQPSGPRKDVKRAPLYGYPAHPVSVLSAQFIASQWYQTCRRTTGAPWKYVAYKVDGGAWVRPEADGSTILVRASDPDRLRKGLALARARGRAVDWVFQAPLWLPSEEHTLTVSVGRRTFKQAVRGNEVVLCNETISGVPAARPPAR